MLAMCCACSFLAIGITCLVVVFSDWDFKSEVTNEQQALMKYLYIVSLIMTGVGCVFQCIAVAAKKPAIMALPGLANMGVSFYLIWYFWSNAFRILDIEESGTFEDDPGFAAFVIKAIFWLTFVFQALAICMCSLTCCIVIVKGKDALPGQKKDDAFGY
jgi:hypothetical protein